MGRGWGLGHDFGATTVNMTANRVITAHFVGRCLLDVVGLPAGGGSVTGSGT